MLHKADLRIATSENRIYEKKRIQKSQEVKTFPLQAVVVDCQ